MYRKLEPTAAANTIALLINELDQHRRRAETAESELNAIRARLHASDGQADTEVGLTIRYGGYWTARMSDESRGLTRYNWSNECVYRVAMPVGRIPLDGSIVRFTPIPQWSRGQEIARSWPDWEELDRRIVEFGSKETEIPPRCPSCGRVEGPNKSTMGT